MSSKYKVLIVEDEKNICHLIGALLEADGYQAVPARDFANGKMLYFSHRPDLMILDLGLPDGDGMDLLREIRKDSLVPVIVLSARADESDKVAALDLNEEAVKKLADECKAEGFICEGYKANVLEPEALEAVHQQVLADLGPCDILVNGAGGNNPRATTDNEYQHEWAEGQKGFFDLDAGGVDFVFKLNFQGTLLPTQAFAKDMVERKSGCILNVSSMNAYIPLTKIPAYSGAKAAVSNFTQWLAVHFSKAGIRVNAIAPGFFSCKQNAALLWNPDGSPTPRTEKILAATPMGRFGQPEELLGALLFLLDNNAAGFITGVVIPVDGGFSAYSGV